ncbi:MAG TPA: nitroreductase/quinone reductase family protein [Dermatophilaceae bacterium]|nr:nitroreductase/quinone reductase family protein [Dermatophilaceae bacterium]
MRPSPITVRLLNRLVLRTALWDVYALEVPRGRTGGVQRVPVVPVDVGEDRFVVSNFGESAWVRNLRAAGVLTLARKGERTTYQAVEVPVERRGPVLRAYRAKAGWQVAYYFWRRPDPADHPVFSLRRTPPTG